VNKPIKRAGLYARVSTKNNGQDPETYPLDVLECENCGGRLRIIAAIHPPNTTRKILDCLGLPSKAPPLTPAVLEASLVGF
jgi:hypothetical protein